MSESPNILVIISDHLSPEVIGAYGDLRGCTPNIDRLAAQGVKFGSAYANCPLCQPSRASFWSSRYPHETRVLSNGRKHVNGPLPDDLRTLGEVFSEAGYRTIHFGKEHDFGTLRGFERVASDPRPSQEEPHPAWPEHGDTLNDNGTVEVISEWLRNPDRQPFVAVADLNNPHDICGWTGVNQSLDGPVENVPPPMDLPSLPNNFYVEDMAQRPLPVQYICCTHRRLAQATGWTEENYRHYLAAYYHYTYLADQAVGNIMDALHATAAGDNTLVVVMGDHGDGMAHHGMVTKQVSLYEETTRVPFILAGPGIPQRDEVLTEPLVSLLDLFPTLCDYAGLAVPSPTRGASVLPAIRGERDRHHTYIVAEWHTEWGFTVSPGRMVRTRQFKYIRYLEGESEELYDMINDPGETRNLVPDSPYSAVLAEHRQLLQEHLRETADPFEELEVQVAPCWRHHAPGYWNHTGPAAPM